MLLVRTNWLHVDVSRVHLYRFPQVVLAQAGWWSAYVKRPKANVEASLRHGWMQAAGSLHRVSLAAAKCQQSLEEGRGSVKVLGSVGLAAPLQSWVGTKPAGVVRAACGGRRSPDVARLKTDERSSRERLRAAASRRCEYDCQPAGRGACQVLSPRLAGKLGVLKLPYVGKTLVCSFVMSRFFGQFLHLG